MFNAVTSLQDDNAPLKSRRLPDKTPSTGHEKATLELLVRRVQRVPKQHRPWPLAVSQHPKLSPYH